MPSTMITAPSTIIPKSMAPRLIRFAQTPVAFIKMNANNKDKGIREAVINPPLKLPSKNTNTNTTINAPSIRFLATVLVVLPINSLRSTMGSICNPSGNEFCISAIRSRTLFTVAFGFEPFSIMMIPPTASSPSCVKAP